MTEITAQQLTERLASHQIKPTAMRLLVLRQLMEASQTLTLRELEEALAPADRSTIFRTLNLFVQQHVVHVVDDGSGATRYEICHGHHTDDEDDRHPHFRCIHCGRTICLTEQRMPPITLPEGFVSHNSNYIITGLCAECSSLLGQNN